MTPVVVFIGMFALVTVGVLSLLTIISQRNSRAEDRLAKHSRPASLAEIEVPGKQSREERFGGVKKAVEDLGAVLKPQSEFEQSALKVKLANAGFRSDAAPGIFQGLRLASLVGFGLFGIFLYMINKPLPLLPHPMMTPVVMFGLGLFVPNFVLGYLKGKRQQAIFLTLPDALDLLVVCVESGLGLDAGLRRVTDEMKDHAKVLCEEFSLANFQMQMGRPRREVLHDLGVRTGVDDVRSLAAILIQADRFGSSIAQALRVQSDSMRTRRRQIAEEKAAKTAVQLIFPLVLFIFPGIFIVLVGPAAIQIYESLATMRGE
jgi:tight adherence protein C